ncbi:MAG: phenylacetate-CoA oxygenase subunit PaaJ [Betaproteobacteria bacterium]|nr:phenylacetate-CoA oxygenase subunit PaaJ [Betaproteobacteria bacterium]
MVTDEQRALAAAAGAGAAVPPVDVVWDALAGVPDPEIPAVSIVELGMVRAVGWDGGRLRVEVTPTYSGCPATDVIAGMIRERLAAIGFADVDVVMRLSPPWSTDWIAPEAKAKLAAYGIAPPQSRAVVVDVAGVSPKGRPRGRTPERAARR